MLAGILIIAFSLALLIYWFRYSCVLVLRNYSEAATASAADDGRFHVSEVQAQLRGEGEEFDPLHAALQRDYAMLVYLVEHAAGLELRTIEDRLLIFDYKVMRLWYRFTKTIAPGQARGALAEMASVLGILAGRMERARGHGAA